MNATAAKGKNGPNIEANHLPIWNKFGNECQHVVVGRMATYGNDDRAVHKIEVEVRNLHRYPVHIDTWKHWHFTNCYIKCFGNTSILRETFEVAYRLVVSSLHHQHAWCGETGDIVNMAVGVFVKR